MNTCNLKKLNCLSLSEFYIFWWPLLRWYLDEYLQKSMITLEVCTLIYSMYNVLHMHMQYLTSLIFTYRYCLPDYLPSKKGFSYRHKSFGPEWGDYHRFNSSKLYMSLFLTILFKFDNTLVCLYLDYFVNVDFYKRFSKCLIASLSICFLQC